LIIIVIAFGAVAIDFAFRSLLIDQTTLSITQTAEQIERSAVAAPSFAFTEGPLLLILSDRATLDRWASANEYVQIDTLQGQVVGKSSNLGELTFPPLHGHGVERRIGMLPVHGEQPGSMLVVDQVLTDADGRAIAVAHVGARLDNVDALTARARTILLGVTLGAMLVILITSFFIAATAIDPIQKLTAAIAEIGSDRLDLRLRWSRRDEVGRLAQAFDAMLDRLQSAFARERQFISDASHELRTPLTVINANAQLLQRWGDRDPAVRTQSLEAIAEESARLAGMVSGMLTLAKAESGDSIPKEPLVLERLIDDVAAHARERAAAKGLALDVRRADGASTIVVGDAGLLRQLVGNLLDNAIKFTESGGIEATIRRNGSRAIIEVADSGMGIEAASADHLFDRFFRGDPSHARTVEGTGLGLAIVRSIARIHGGTVAAQPRPEGGSLFTVTLPAEPESFTPDS
jgi:signal transduction histidine kinase